MMQEPTTKDCLAVVFTVTMILIWLSIVIHVIDVDYKDKLQPPGIPVSTITSWIIKNGSTTDYIVSDGKGNVIDWKVTNKK